MEFIDKFDKNKVKVKVNNSMIYNTEIINAGDEVFVDVNFARYIVGMKQAEYVKEKVIIKNQEEVLNNKKEEVIENKIVEEKTAITRRGKK